MSLLRRARKSVGNRRHRKEMRHRTGTHPGKLVARVQKKERDASASRSSVTVL